MQLKPTLGPVQLIFYSVGVIIGAGIYSVIGTAAALADQSLWMSFAIGAGVALLTAISYAEMTTSFPAAGAEYVYIRKALPNADWAAFGVGIVILVGGAATASTVATAFGGYLETFIDMPPALSAFALLVACTAINTRGLRESSWANILFTCIEVAGLGLVVAAGFSEGAYSQAPPLQWHPGVMSAAALLFFVYLGFEEVANLTEEVHNPARDLPRALLISLAITTVLYVLVSIAVVRLASPSDLATSDAPLALTLHKTWPGAERLLSAIALFATANTVLITLIATSRLAFSMGRDRELPTIFAELLPGRRTPWVGALLAFTMSASLLPIGSVRILAEMSSFAALIAFLAVNVALVILRYRLPDHRRPFRVPLAIGRLPVLPVLAIASIALLLAHFGWTIYLAGAIALVVTAMAFLVREWNSRRRTMLKQKAKP